MAAISPRSAVMTDTTSGVLNNKEQQSRVESTPMESPHPVISPQKAVAIARFRELCTPLLTKYGEKSSLLAEVQNTDRGCERYLIARGWDPVKAAGMLGDVLKWRETNNIDSILDEPHPECLAIRRAMGNHCEHKFDKEGRPVYIEYIGSLDAGKLLKEHSMESIMFYNLHSMEWKKRILYPELSRRAGKNIDQVVSILDLKGFGTRHMNSSVYKFLKELSGTTQAYYPEVLHKLFIINAPFLFSATWRMIKAWLGEMTKEKIVMSKDSGKDKLLEVINEQDLPVDLGGKCLCPGEGGCRENSWTQKAYALFCVLGAKKFDWSMVDPRGDTWQHRLEEIKSAIEEEHQHEMGDHKVHATEAFQQQGDGQQATPLETNASVTTAAEETKEASEQSSQDAQVPASKSEASPDEAKASPASSICFAHPGLNSDHKPDLSEPAFCYAHPHMNAEHKPTLEDAKP